MPGPADDEAEVSAAWQGCGVGFALGSIWVAAPHRHSGRPLAPPTVHDRSHSLWCRLRSVSLLSKRFRALCLDSLLIREVSISLAQQTSPEATLRSLHRWLAVNAQHLRSFDMNMYSAADPALLMGCLAACCAAAPLETLLLSLGSEPLPTLAWLLSVCSTLSRLELHFCPFTSSGPLIIDAPLQHCTALTNLSMQCRNLEFALGCRLPTSLTALKLGGLSNGLPSQASALTSCPHTHQHTQCLPKLAPMFTQCLHQCCHMAQILALPQLADLEMADCECLSMDDPQPMPAMTSITRLTINDCNVHTVFLVALPELRHLDLWNANNEDADTLEAVNASFSSLRQLTYVSLFWRCTIPPASLIHLTNLRRLKVYFDERCFQEGVPAGVGCLPSPGAWSSGLQKLGITDSIAFRSLDTLRRLPALQHLRLYGSTAGCTKSAAAWGGLLEAAAANQKLQRIDLVDSDEEELVVPYAVIGILLQLKDTHPHLTIRRGAFCDTWDD